MKPSCNRYVRLVHHLTSVWTLAFFLRGQCNASLGSFVIENDDSRFPLGCMLGAWFSLALLTFLLSTASHRKHFVLEVEVSGVDAVSTYRWVDWNLLDHFGW